MTLLDMTMVGIGGFFGAMIRYLFAKRWNRGDKLPAGTLLVNLSGALLIGIVFGLELPMMWTFLLASGFAGALTTFSTLTKELIENWRNGKKKQAVGYFLSTYVGGMMLVVVGYTMGGHF
ncbi:fluoride efflux transporter CrcB [Sporosarcina sp. ACRSM]|uniref:fluoride efflux transporter CrcB n=1 Tax=Sporosarcina sp. ACRSM TaxID=2918216 RepID=UPI001EF43B9C|nr:fluoride efflux transporter CrcB [Sporosarcina sp. ACRSM]MCG7335937.1 fluoride efflux transporter CrcB [Sporosarcina sp. ACRSM]